MSDEKRFETMHEDHKGHPFAFGLLAGTAVGVGIGLLVAPTKGAEARKQVGNQLAHMKSACATGFTRARGTAEDWAHKSRDAYGSSRDFVARSARETGRYMRDVADAVTMRSRRALEHEGQQSESVKNETIAGATRERARRPPLTAQAG
jgi:gas vesicle protein